MVVESKGYWRWPPHYFQGPTISKRYTTLRDATGAQQHTQDCGLYGVEIAHEQAPEDELFEEGAEKHLGRKREEYAQAVLEWRI